MSKAPKTTATTQTMRTTARDIFQSAVEAADPTLALRRHLAAHPLGRASGRGKTYLLAIGKAAPAMMAEALAHARDTPVDRALVVTNSGNMRELSGCRMIPGDHPIPGALSLVAGREAMSFVAGLGAEDRLVALVSGGGSALIAAPVEGISLAQKAEVTHMMLSQGFDIEEINLVRQQISQIKGGKLAALAAPAEVRSIILSDVIGDDVRAIASGPTTGPIGTRGEACRLMKKRDLFDHLPTPVRRLLGRTESGLPARTPFEAAHIIGSNRLSLEAACQAARDHGWPASIVSDRLTGDVGGAASRILSHALAEGSGARRALVFGGETTVALRGGGKGGRNQELALRFALLCDHLHAPWVFLSGGTDGRDGPTDAAGGLVDQGSVARMMAAGIDPDAFLADNNSYEALSVAHDLLKTGPTGTNVADVQILLLAGEDD